MKEEHKHWLLQVQEFVYRKADIFTAFGILGILSSIVFLCEPEIPKMIFPIWIILSLTMAELCWLGFGYCEPKCDNFWEALAIKIMALLSGIAIAAGITGSGALLVFIFIGIFTEVLYEALVIVGILAVAFGALSLLTVANMKLHNKIVDIYYAETKMRQEAEKQKKKPKMEQRKKKKKKDAKRVLAATKISQSKKKPKPKKKR